MAYPWRTAWITGGSSGIGLEVARKLAAGGVRVTVSARSEDTLAKISAQSPMIDGIALDVTDADACRRTAMQLWERHGGLDLVLLNAGVWHPMTSSSLDLAKVRQSIDVNYFGLVNVIDPLVPLMKARGRGQLALTASVAGYRGLPKALAYAPSKAAAIALAEVLKPDLARAGITVSLVNPGFVDTPMTRVNDFPMPFLITPEAAADAIITGLASKRFEIVFPWRMMAAMKLLRVLPYPLFFWMSRRMSG